MTSRISEDDASKGLARQRGLRRISATIVCISCVVLTWRWLTAPASELIEISRFGANPTLLTMHLYVPPQLPPRPAVLLALHWCQGSGPDFHAGTGFARLADRHGFLVIYPSVTRSSLCWDVHSPAALQNGGGSDPRGLISMIQHVITVHGAASDRVFVTGHSSGGMMTQLLLGAYPEVFRAGAAFAGVAFGCFAGRSEWSEDCAQGRVAKAPEEWGELVQRASPGFTGKRPALQLWHGTADESLNFQNFGESIKQWSQVLEITAPASIERNTPHEPWTRLRYVNSSGEVRLEAFRGEGLSHNFNMPAEEVIRFFGLDRNPPQP